MKVDIGIQVGEKKAEIQRDIEEKEAFAMIAKMAPAMEEKLRATNERLTLIQKEIISDPDMAVEYHLLGAAQSKTDEVLNCDLSGRTADEQNKRVDQYHRYSNVGSVLLYRDIHFKGGSKFFSVTWPNFKWWPYKFNDTASSAKAWGANILFEHTWYRGRRLYLVGLPYFEAPDLSKLNFNSIASSFVSIP